MIDLDPPHTVLDTGGVCAATEARGARSVNMLLGNVKCATSGRYHVVKHGKYARRYWVETAHGFNPSFACANCCPG